MFEPRVMAYLRSNGEMHIHATSLLRGTAGVPSDPFFVHSTDDCASEIGNAVLKAKEGSLSFIDRENYLEYIPPYVESAGVKNLSQFAKKTKSVYIKFNGEQIKFRPTKNVRGTWHGMQDKVVHINLEATAQEIGEQLLKSFEDAVA